MTRPPLPGQVLEVIELQRPGRNRRDGQLGGQGYEEWLAGWAARSAAGQRIAVLIDYPRATHCVVVAR